jgi:hypothetical protein
MSQVAAMLAAPIPGVPERHNRGDRMSNPLSLIERAITHHANVADAPPTTAAVATDVFAVLVVNAAELDPRMELPVGTIRAGGLDVEHDEALPAGRVVVQ